MAQEDEKMIEMAYEEEGMCVVIIKACDREAQRRP